MKKQIITLGLAVLVAGSSAYGFDMRGGKGCQDNSLNNHKKGMLLKSHKSSNSTYGLMSSISDLDLSRVQKVEIRKVMFDLREKNIEKMEDKNTHSFTFNQNGDFNKKDFINNRVKLSKKTIKLQSEMIEKILNILDKEQKKIVLDKLSQKRG